MSLFCEDYGDYGDEDNKYTQFDLQDEGDAYERTGQGAMLGTRQEGEGKKGYRVQETPAQRFMSSVNTKVQKFFDEGVFDQEGTDRQVLNDAAVKVPNPSFKNPTAFILGYIASDGGTNISATNLTRAKELLNLGEEDGVKMPDVLRYARLWEKML